MTRIVPIADSWPDRFWVLAAAFASTSVVVFVAPQVPAPLRWWVAAGLAVAGGALAVASMLLAWRRRAEARAILFVREPGRASLPSLVRQGRYFVSADVELLFAAGPTLREGDGEPRRLTIDVTFDASATEAEIAATLRDTLEVVIDRVHADGCRGAVTVDRVVWLRAFASGEVL